MKNWRHGLKLFASCFLILSIIFIFNQLMQLYRNLATIHPLVGLFTIFILAGLMLYFIFITGRELLRLPKEIQLADGASPEEYQEYLEECLKRLSQNPQLLAKSFNWSELNHLSKEEQILAGYSELRQIGIVDIKLEAQTVFLSTAISQNGALDALTVLIVLLKMVWRLIILYDTRPSLGKILSIYSHVATTILMARGVEDLDLIEAQVEPLISSILGGSLLSMIPGSVSLMNLIANSILEGSINALLTLRVGIVTMNYLESLKDANQQSVKRSATIEATQLLASIIKDGSVKVAQVMLKSIKNTSLQTSRKWNPFSK